MRMCVGRRPKTRTCPYRFRETGGGRRSECALVDSQKREHARTGLEKLAADKSFEVRWQLAENPNTPASALEKLAADEDDNVRAEVARNPSTPVPV